MPSISPGASAGVASPFVTSVELASELLSYAPASAGRLPAVAAPARIDVERACGFAGLDKLSISTYDGANSVTHPSVLHFPEKWNGYYYWMAATPYPSDNAAYENPSIWASLDGDTWVVPPGGTNPVEPAIGGSGYNSDTHLEVGPDGTVYLFWRAYMPSQVGTEERIYYRSSTDGVTWSAKTLVRSADATVERLLSPAVFWDGDQWVMYAVDFIPSPNEIVRLTSDTLTGTWTSAVTCTCTFPSGKEPWHLDAKKWGDQVLLLVNDTTTGQSGANGDLFLCSATDGVTFTRSTFPVIPRASAWHNTTYRASLVPRIGSDGRVGFDCFFAGRQTSTHYVGRGTITLTRPTSGELARQASADIYGAVSLIWPYKGGDDFNRADGSLATSSSGLAWTNQSGTSAIESKTAKAGAASQHKATLNPGISDGFFEMSMPTRGGEGWLMVRFSDINNYVRAGFHTSNGLLVQKIVVGVATDLIRANQTPDLDHTNVRVGLLLSGSTIELWLDGVKLASVSDSFNSTQTLFGFQTASTSPRFDNFWCRALVNGA